MFSSENDSIEHEGDLNFEEDLIFQKEQIKKPEIIKFARKSENVFQKDTLAKK